MSTVNAEELDVIFEEKNSADTAEELLADLGIDSMVRIKERADEIVKTSVTEGIRAGGKDDEAWFADPAYAKQVVLAMVMAAWMDGWHTRQVYDARQVKQTADR